MVPIFIRNLFYICPSIIIKTPNERSTIIGEKPEMFGLNHRSAKFNMLRVGEKYLILPLFGVFIHLIIGRVSIDQNILLLA